ncbi:hypothetical protein BW899_06635 [Bacillus mycoides]|uniref:hypothetical protein n=1 Tax=Bacillus TaxID=1386 RepID=UPI00099285DC|nr:hypothetical protein [Bacillus mycoides]OOR01639.1 hypothetical protein BW899_06635 [Bacillus mycoides]HDR7585530.1 hypothetical protein [Bacillus mycoides]
MKTETVNTWKEQWKEFYNESLKGNEARINMLNFTNEHIEKIFSKLNELRMVLPHMAEVFHVLHHSLTNDNYDFEYRSLGFEITINEHIQICVEPQSETDAAMEIECKVEFENECLSFMIDEHDHEELKIDMES